MYIHPAFRMERAASLAFAAARGFGLVIACDAGRPLASPLPFRIDGLEDGTPRLALHVARVNPLAEAAARGGTWMVAVDGADAYVSPEWYASHDQVPTWLYETVQLSGPVRVVSHEARRTHLVQLSQRFEGGEPPWTPDRVTPARRDMLTQAVIAIEMDIETVEGSAKLNQHKSDADQVNIVRALARQDDRGAHIIAHRMMALRPNLDYGLGGDGHVAPAAMT